MMSTFVEEMKVCADEDGLIQDATNALANAQKRYLDGQAMRLDSVGIALVRAVVQDYATCIEMLPHRLMIECHKRTEKKVHELSKAKSNALVQVVKI